MRGVISEEMLAWHKLSILVQHKLVRGITLRLKPDGTIMLTVPYGLPKRVVLSFLEEKEPWLRKKLEQLPGKTQGHYLMGEIPFDGQHVWLWGRRIACRFTLIKNGRPDYQLTPEAVTFLVDRELNFAQQAELVQAMYAYEVRVEGAKLIASWQQRMGVRCSGLRVHVMKTRWGSCNVRSGNINLNTLLACWPKECLEYIVVHELTHLLETNHTPRFHQLVGSFLPVWRERKQLLEGFQPV